mmetsp:Transcript_55111/g.148600  ORF Transcript_55111/g.148600 Transcript_55111/m.148600 type:complete len:488 (-) Transcript_55111:110-1573(-)
MATTDVAEQGPPPLAEVIERIGFGWAQLRVVLLGGCVWLADGSELLLIGTVTRAVSDEWGMRAWQRGSTVSIVFLGILLGNGICGPVGDRYGRRLPILVSYLGIAVFSILSAFTQNFYQLAAVRLFVGASFGIGQPAINALSSEVCPAYWRIMMNALTQTLFIFGELYSAVLVWWDDPMMRHLDWRWLLLMGSIPSVVCLVFSWLWLHESPSYFAVHGDYAGAKRVLESFCNDNGKVGLNVDFKLPPPKKESTPLEVMIENFWVICSRRLLYSTIAVIYSCFTLNVVFYGCLYAFPQVLTEVDMNAAPAVSLVFGALWELPGNVLAVFCGMFWPRKPVMIGYLVATALSLLAFGLGADQVSGGSEHWLHLALVHGGYIGIKCFAIVGFVAVYQYSTEIYPTVARTTGTAACVAGGRLGGMVAPLVFEWIVEATANISIFFYFTATLCIVNIMFVLFLPLETFGRSLDDYNEENETLPLTATKHKVET